MNITTPLPPILVVEDEVFVRMVAADALTEEGLRIFEAGDAAEALEVLAAHPEIGILFTDINMPGDMDGLELAQRVSAMRPDIRIIVTSGRQQPSRASMPPEGTFLPKPYAPRGLVWAVEGTSGH